MNVREGKIDRKILLQIIRIAPQIISPSEPKKMRVGDVHECIAKALKIPLNIKTKKLIKMVYLANGVRQVTIHGFAYFTSYPAIWYNNRKREPNGRFIGY